MTRNDIISFCGEIDSLKDRFSFSDEDWEGVRLGVNGIRVKAQDLSLYLGVVGEFSCGKSTFINALLGVDLLKEDILQGTTCAPTFVRYWDSFDVLIHAGGRTLKVSDRCDFTGCSVEECIARVRDEIFKYTADEQFASRINSVEILLPIANPLFDNGIVLVDTPGINAENPRHQLVAEQTVREVCDTVLILTPSNIPCSTTLVSFVRDKIGESSHRCVGMVTCLDRLRPRERSGTISYVSSRFSSEGCPLAGVYGVAAYYAAHSTEESENPIALEFKSDFGKVVESIVSKTVEDRNAIVTEKLQELIHDLVDTKLSERLKAYVEELTAREEALEKNKLRDVKGYLEEKRASCKSSVQLCAPSSAQIRAAVDDECEKALDGYIYRLYASRNLTTLKERTSHDCVSFVLETCKSNSSAMAERLAEGCRVRAETLMNNLNDEFNKEFRNLAGNAGRSIGRKKLSGSADVKVNMRPCGDLVDAVVPQEAVKFGGAIAGVVIGSILLPGIGTVVGGVVGNWLGAFFGRSLDDLKREAEHSVRRIIREWKPVLYSSLEEYACSRYPQEVKRLIDSCIEQYASAAQQVQRIVEEEIKEQEGLGLKIKDALNVQEFFKKAFGG